MYAGKTLEATMQLGKYEYLAHLNLLLVAEGSDNGWWMA